MGLACLAARAADEPLWEAGMGVAAVYLPDYRGSDHSRGYALPFPYFVYRGDFFKSDREGVRGIFYRTISSTCTCRPAPRFRGEQEQPGAHRHARPSPSIELGPALDVRLWRSPDRKATVEARFPLRFAVTVESHPEYIGAQLSPHLNLDVTDPLGVPGGSSACWRGRSSRTRATTGTITVCPPNSPRRRDPSTPAPRLRRHAIHHGALEALSVVLGGRLRALRHAARRRLRREPARDLEALRRGRHRDRVDPGRIEGEGTVELGRFSR
jgi:hypothetical protein